MIEKCGLDKDTAAQGDIYKDGDEKRQYVSWGNNKKKSEMVPLAGGIRVVGVGKCGDSNGLDTPDRIVASRYRAIATAYVNTIGICFYYVTTGSKMLAAIYDEDSSFYPNAKLGTTGEHTFVDNDDDAELLINLISPVKVTKGKFYWIAMNVDAGANYSTFLQGTRQDAQVGKYKALTYDGTMPDTFPASGSNHYSRYMSAIT